MSPLQQGRRSFSAVRAQAQGYKVVGYEAIGIGEGSLAPLVAFRLTGPNGVVLEDSGLIDTGADSSAFPLWMMERLGISKENCEECEHETSGGMAKQWIWRDDNAGGLAATILNRDIRLRAVFTDTPISLLGRDDFLANFKIRFAQRGLWYAIRPYRIVPFRHVSSALASGHRSEADGKPGASRDPRRRWRRPGGSLGRRRGFREIQ